MCLCGLKNWRKRCGGASGVGHDGVMAEVVLFTVICRDRSRKIRGDVAVLRKC